MTTNTTTPKSGNLALPAESFRRVVASLPAERFSILGAEISLRTDSEPLRSFFSHAYRWFPARAPEPEFTLSAVLGGDECAPAASVGDTSIDLSASPSPVNRAFLFLLEAVMDRISGSIVLHGAAASLDDRGIIIAGPALAGKSTLTLELLRQGHRFLSDDAAPLERSTGLLLPFPRAVGIRKGSPGSRLPSSGVLEMPHKWLVDPAALGARLPVSPCPPAFLFYLDAEESVSPRGEGERTFQVACAEESEILRSELREMHPEAIGTLDDGPFPGISVRFGKGARPMTGLTALWRRHRDSILYIEELRPPASRRQGDAVIRPVEAASLLIPLVRDMLNRGDDGLLMKSHSGRLTSLVAELAGLLRSVACYRVTAGTPELTAEAVDRVVRGRKGRV